MNQYLTDYASLRSFLLLSVEAFAFLTVMAYSLSALRRGGWAVLGAAGGALGGFASLALGIGWAQVEFSDDFGVFAFFADHEPLSDALDFALPVALVLVAAGFILGRAPTLDH